jgi:hypothetical protein
MHDPRVGRFFAVDPLTKKYPWYTPYQFSGNKVIHAIELEGLEEYFTNDGVSLGQVGDDQSTRVMTGVASGSEAASQISSKISVINALSSSSAGVTEAGKRVADNLKSDLMSNSYTKGNILEYMIAQGTSFSNGFDSGIYTFTNDAIDFVSENAWSSDYWGNKIHHTVSNFVSDNINATANGEDYWQYKMHSAYNSASKMNAYEWGFTTGYQSGVFATTSIFSYGVSGLRLGLSSVSLTTSDGFLFRGFTMNAPFDISVQRFGTMSISRPDYWGARIGTSIFSNRTFAAIKIEWNPLNLYTRGVIPKGTPIKFGVIGPQGWKYPGGSMQFIVPSNKIINQTSKAISR